jgi:DNA-binding transcriptional ArsR family regulator
MFAWGSILSKMALPPKMRPVATRSTAREEKDSVASSDAIQFALGHPIRVATLAILAEGPSKSPKEIAALLGEGVQVVGNHARALRDRGCIEVARTRRVRNANQPYYRLPEHPTNALGLLIQAIAVELMGALRARTLESDDDLVAAFAYIELDKQGRRDLARGLERHQERVREIGATAERRLAASGGEGVATVITSMAFERCRPIKKASGGEHGSSIKNFNAAESPPESTQAGGGRMPPFTIGLDGV